MPTASAIAKRSPSTRGRPSQRWTAKTSRTRTAIAWVSRRPKSRRPRSKSVSSVGVARRAAMSPKTVARPVSTTSIRAEPLRTFVPR
jgi:hypothetical protein